uniref:F-box domain-containing protein n=1 Tax=Oryza rufipogon TaxID=4529 RepID=A0A0E0NY04_ORYRU
MKIHIPITRRHDRGGPPATPTVPLGSLAACRRICTSWRAAIDDRLREDLLPLSLAGIFLNLHDLFYPTQFFSCPTTTPPGGGGGAVSGNVDYTRRRSTLPDCHMPSINITDHCNGLVLVNNCVTYPATRRWERLPDCQLPRRHPRHVASTASARFAAVREHLVFDPAVYEVFLIPHVAPRERERRRRRRDDEFYPTSDGSEWPPSPFFLSVFSSETRQWEGRRFVRDGPPAGTVAAMRLHHASEVGTEYHCQVKYQVIGPPLSFDVCRYKEFHLGRSEKGVYFALLSSNQLLKNRVAR